MPAIPIPADATAAFFGSPTPRAVIDFTLMTKVAVKRVEPLWMQPQAAPPPPRRPADPSADFADYVRNRLDAPILPYSNRLALLKEAQRRGVGRFEANLVIAQQMHRQGMTYQYNIKPKSTRLSLLLTVALLQTAIAVGFWWLIA